MDTGSQNGIRHSTYVDLLDRLGFASGRHQLDSHRLISLDECDEHRGCMRMLLQRVQSCVLLRGHSGNWSGAESVAPKDRFASSYSIWNESQMVSLITNPI